MTNGPVALPDANQLLLTGGKAPEGADFPQPGATVAGRALSGPTSYHAREFDAKNPGQGPLRYWPDGNPVVGVYLDLDCPGIGIRRLYVEKLRMTTAIQQAMLSAGVQKIEPGGFLTVTWTGTEQGQGNLPANTYAASYAPPGALPPANNILAGNGHSANLPQSGPAQWQQGVPSAPYNAAAVPQSQPQYAPAPQAAPAPVPVAAPVAAPAPSAPVLTETIAVAMRNAGIPTDGYVIVPG